MEHTAATVRIDSSSCRFHSSTVPHGTYPPLLLSALTVEAIRDAPFDILWGEGGARIKLKKIVCRHQSQKIFFCWKCEQKKKFVVGIDEKYVDQKKHQMVTYIIGKAYDKKFLRRNIKKKLSDVDRKKKTCFPPEEKKKFASNKNSTPPPPPRY